MAGHRTFVTADDFLAGALHLNLPTFDPKGALTKPANRGHLVRYKNDGAAVAGDIRHLAEALFLKLEVADSEYLIDKENFGFQVGGDCKGKAHLHTGAITLQRCIEKALDFRKSDNFFEFAVDFGLAHAENCTAHVDIFSTAELAMKAGSNFKEAP